VALLIDTSVLGRLANSADTFYPIEQSLVPRQARSPYADSYVHKSISVPTPFIHVILNAAIQSMQIFIR
jgi:hypothetical protein